MALIRALLLGLLVTQPAHALSCLRADAVRSYLDRAERPDQVVLLGTFDFTPGALDRPDGTMTRIPEDKQVAGQFRGEDLLTGTRIEGPITVVSHCMASWCGNMVPGIHLAFGTQTAAGLVVSVDPCGTAAFPDPDMASLARLERCMVDRDCEILE
ncbi:hypothetical protein [Dinoroseobacter sp. S124A]|uniref:hypothetical protein n=1 Tax=Dinoroseobacter sp. S124A TaxID=3415128 RepID=UPI003C7D61DD